MLRQGEQAVVRMPQQPWRCVVLENEDTTDKLRRGPFSTSCVHCYYLGIEEVNTKLSNHVKTASLRFRGGGIGVCVPRYPVQADKVSSLDILWPRNAPTLHGGQKVSIFLSISKLCTRFVGSNKAKNHILIAKSRICFKCSVPHSSNECSSKCI